MNAYRTTINDLSVAIGLTRSKRVMDLPAKMIFSLEAVCPRGSLRELPVEEAHRRVKEQIERHKRWARSKDWKFDANALIALAQLDQQMKDETR